MNRVFQYFSRFATTLDRRSKYAILLVLDIILVPISLVLTGYLYGNGLVNQIIAKPEQFFLPALGLAVAGAAVSAVFGLPRIKLNAYENSGIQRTAVSAVVLGGLSYVWMAMLIEQAPQARIVVLFTLVMVVLSVAARISLRSLLLKMYQSGSDRQRVLIYGAGQAGLQLARALWTDDAVEPVAFVDDNPSLHFLVVAGLPVHPSLRIQRLVQEKNIQRVVLAMPSISRPKQARIVQQLAQVGCEVSILPSFAALIGEGQLIDQVLPADPAHFLNRKNLECDLDRMCDIYTGAVVMITGAGGSIGSELARQILMCRPAKLVLFELSESALYHISRELEDLGLTDSAEVVGALGSVTDERVVRHAIAHHSVDIVLHAAAYKHVNIVENNVLTGLHNNVIGTKIVANAARDGGVGHFILVSTDKAVRPTSVMGASKRLAEFIIQDLSVRPRDTKFSIVRFGNVLGSSGSVVPLFADQIARGGPVTLTHHDVTRYFMTLSEAARLVLLAGNFTKGGDMFVLDMGAAVPIRRLARQMIETAGYTVCDGDNPRGDIEITIRGLMPGEKLHEELVSPDSILTNTDHPKILATNEVGLSELEVASALNSLEKALDASDTVAARAVIWRWVGRYCLDQDHKVSLYSDA
jgi:FlaA1/EpsC-like NDP-sugar epimerase